VCQRSKHKPRTTNAWDYQQTRLLETGITEEATKLTLTQRKGCRMKEPNGENIKSRLQELKNQEETKELDNLIKLSNRNILIAVLLSIIIPIGGYIYTKRWKAFLILLGSGFLVGTAIGLTEKDSDKVAEKAFSVGSLIGSIAAPIDNGLAIWKAKKKLEEKMKS